MVIDIEEKILYIVFITNIIYILSYFYDILHYIILINFLFIIHPINKKITYVVSLHLDNYIDDKNKHLHIR